VEIALKQRTQRRVIDCPVHIELYNERTARGLGWLSDFPCGGGRDAYEVKQVLDLVFAGRDDPNKVVVAYDDQDTPISLAVVQLDGHRALTREPYVEAIVRHDDFRRAVLRDRSTSAGGAAARGVLDMLALQYGPANLPSVTTLVRVGNVGGHSLATQANFAPLPRALPSGLVLYRRPSRVPLPPPLDPSVYVPPTRPSVRFFVSRPTTRDSPGLGRNHPCWCGSGKKLKKCHGA
jgi:hypothetical protein